MKSSAKQVFWGLLLSLAAPIVDCFIVRGGVGSSSSFQRSRGGRCVNRPLQQHLHGATSAVRAHSRSPHAPLAVAAWERIWLAHRAGVGASFRLREVCGMRVAERGVLVWCMLSSWNWEYTILMVCESTAAGRHPHVHDKHTHQQSIATFHAHER